MCIVDIRLSIQNITLFLWGGQVKMSFGQVFVIKFILYFPEWVSGAKKLMKHPASIYHYIHVISNFGPAKWDSLPFYLSFQS